MNAKERLLEFIRYKKIAVSTFESNCGLSNGYIKNSKGNIGAKKLDDILNAYPELSQNWVLFGQGEMLATANPTLQNTTKSAEGRPFYAGLPVTAGRVVQYPDVLRQLPSGCIDIPQARGAEFFFPVIGMSMLPTIEEGDIIGVCHVDRYETTNADRLYMIVTRDNERMIKRILAYDADAGRITLGSDNPNYPAFVLSADLVADVYKVVLLLKVETL